MSLAEALAAFAADDSPLPSTSSTRLDIPMLNDKLLRYGASHKRKGSGA